MCGIVGLIGKPSMAQVQVFDTMLASSVGRGYDSTGVAGTNGGNPATFKHIVTPIELMRYGGYRKVVMPTNIAIFGHCRAATRGSVSVKNAHPFQYEHITMVHNGTLDKKMDVDGIKNSDLPETDSETIAISIAQKGIEATWKELAGAASIIFWDTKEGSLNFISNGKRPLCFAHTADKAHLLVASERWMLEVPAVNGGWKLHKGEVWNPGDNWLYSCTFDKDKGMVKVAARELKAKVPFVVQVPVHTTGTKKNNTGASGKETQTTHNMTGAWQRARSKWYDRKTGESTSQQEVTRESVIDAKTKVSSNVSLLLTEQEFKDGHDHCFFCHKSLEGQYNEATLIDDDTVACGDCTAAVGRVSLTPSQAAKGVGV